MCQSERGHWIVNYNDNLVPKVIQHDISLVGLKSMGSVSLNVKTNNFNLQKGYFFIIGDVR